MRFKFYNRQPLGKIEQDCVCRAISLALNKDYYAIEEKLKMVGYLFNCEELCVCCYKHLLDYVYDLPRIECYQGFTIREFMEKEPYGIYIVRVKGHLTCVIDGEIWDIWNCENEIVDIVWQVA